MRRPLLHTISLEVPGSLGEPGSALCLRMAAVSEGLASSSWGSKGSTFNLFSAHFLFEEEEKSLAGEGPFLPADSEGQLSGTGWGWGQPLFPFLLHLGAQEGPGASDTSPTPAVKPAEDDGSQLGPLSTLVPKGSWHSGSQQCSLPPGTFQTRSHRDKSLHFISEQGMF